MGRHSSRSQFAYYRSVVGWALPWFLIAAVFATGVWFAVDAMGGDSGGEPKVASATDQPTSERSKSPTPRARPSPSPSKENGDSPFQPGDDTQTEKLITEGITIQVLNGTSSSLAGTDMADELSRLGFEVVVVNEASKPYPSTTVFWSTEAARGAAEALAGRFDWVAEVKPANLTDSVSLHVVVGEDYL